MLNKEHLDWGEVTSLLKNLLIKLFSKEKESALIIRRLLKYLIPHKKKFSLAILAMVVYGATDGVIPLVLKHILDKIFGDKDVSMLYIIPVFLISFSILRALFGFTQQYLSSVVGLSIIKDIRDDIHAKLLELTPSFYKLNQSGNLISRMTNDTLLVRTALTDATAALLRDTVRIIALVVAALYLDPYLGLFALVLFPLAIYPIIQFGRRVRSHSRAGQDRLGGLTSNLHETIGGYKVIQSFNLQNFIQNRFKQKNSIFTKSLKKAERYSALSGPTNEALSSFAIAAIIFYGGSSVISGTRTQGQFVAFLVAVILMYEPAKKLGKINSTIQTGVASAERIFELLDEKVEIQEKVDARELKISKASVQFEDLCFSYNPEKKNSKKDFSLDNINLEINSGSTLALVGPSGGGKSTLVNFLPRFYDPVKGRVLISGQDVKDVTLSSLRDVVSVVDQNTFLFNDTVSNNISFGNPNASFEEIKEAAKDASSLEFIEAMPQGFDTVIGEQGLNLSGGQRARLAIARALLKDSPILVLDEATAALDSESEQHVQKAIERLMKGRTVVVIAHRLATVLSADKIAVIVDGKVKEQGNHQSLLKLGGEYAKLYNIQFGDKQLKLA